MRRDLGAKIGSGILLIGLFISLIMIPEDKGLARGLQLISSLAMASMVGHIFYGVFGKKQSTLRYSYILWTLNGIWAISFLGMNIVKGNIFKIINLIPILVLGLGLRFMLDKNKNQAKNQDMIKFGYGWVGFVLLIPLLMILVAKGY